MMLIAMARETLDHNLEGTNQDCKYLSHQWFGNCVVGMLLLTGALGSWYSRLESAGQDCKYLSDT